MAPKPIPTAMPIANTSGIAMPGSSTKKRPVRNATKPSTEPTERSMLRLTTTIVWPTASTPTIDTLSAMSRRFWLLRKFESAIVVPIVSSARMPSRLSSRTRKAASTRPAALRPLTGAGVVTASVPALALMRPALSPARWRGA